MYGVKEFQRNGDIAAKKTRNMTNIDKGNPAKKTGIKPEEKTIIAVPKSGCLKIRMLHIDMAVITTIQSLYEGLICLRVK